ncbi:cation:proton antiporter [Acidimicrobiia bacterium EGI L10123]|uniref:cation:proton antiporter domain-containing protein n=1 Tax=Salinilacustrithrix flava TaxID=2957203 RepID=UPI003D7C1D38|nr:cation:proton antiporter [Acidimicrobiia bacterium EGI L10123]
MPDALRLPFDEPASFFVVVFLAILVGPILARWVRLPGIVGLVLVGVAIGPGGAGLLQRDGTVALFGGAGLLYLMFLAGLDLDRESFARERDGALVFSIATTVLPLVITTLAGMALGLEFLAAALLASAFTSHTLVTYPTVQRFGLAETRASVISLGGTLVSTIVALLVLAVVAAAHSGTLGLVFWVGFVGGIVLFFAAAFTGLPRLAQWFFTGLGTDRTVRYSFTLALAFGAALLAEVLGIEPIVGAFVAGLALNRFVPGDALLMERIQFLGSSLLIPIFLVSTGMLIDPVELVTDPEGLVLGAVLTVAAVGSKILAVYPIRLVTTLSRAEVGLMVGLTTAQAAGALAAAIVALDIGLIGVTEVNAVVLVILLTCVLSGALTERFAQSIPRPDRQIPEVGATVVVPIADSGRAEQLVEIAAAIARTDSGVVVPLTVLNFDAAPDEVEQLRAEMTDAVEAVALGGGADLRAMVRIDVTASAGMLHTAIETGASSILLGWKGYAARSKHHFGEDTDAIITLSPVPVLVCRPAHLEPDRIVLDVIDRDLSPAARPTTHLSASVGRRLARHYGVPFVVVTDQHPNLVGQVIGQEVELFTEERTSLQSLPDHTGAGDIVIGGMPATRAGLDRRASQLARALPGRTLLMVSGR